MSDDQSKQPVRGSYEFYKQLWDATIVPGTLHKTRLSPDPEPPPGVTGGEPLRMGWNPTPAETKSSRVEWLEKELENADNEISRLKAELLQKQDEKKYEGFLGSLGQENGTLFSTSSVLSTPDPPAEVTNPSHYTRGGIEARMVIEAWNLNYYMGSALKYICRADYKGDPVQDLQKAIQFLQFEIDRRSNKSARTREKQSERQFRNPYSGAGSSILGQKASSIPGSGGIESHSCSKPAPEYGPGA